MPSYRVWGHERLMDRRIPLCIPLRKLCRCWADGATVVPVAVGAAVLVVFVVNERRARQPILPLRLFASPERSGAATVRLLFAGTGIAFFFFTTQFLQGVYGWTPLRTGLAFLPMTVLQFAHSLTVAGLARDPAPPSVPAPPP
jgi:hypothetical protein